MSYEENENYKGWYEVHKGAFGEIFTDAYADSQEGRVMLTAALNKLSRQDTSGALVILTELGALTEGETDMRALEYFTGLCCEMSGDSESAEEHYTKMAECGGNTKFALPFHPYYRTAKFAQRDSEPRKAEYYFKKAMALYEGYPIEGEVAVSVSMILYDIATLRIFMHDYSEGERLLSLSEKMLPGFNPQREYLKAILLAVKDDGDGAYRIRDMLKEPFKKSITEFIEQILDGRHLHYCESERSRSGYKKFLKTLSDKSGDIARMISEEQTAEIEDLIDGMLTKCFSYMSFSFKKCRAVIENGDLTVYLKTGCSRTLMREYTALLEGKTKELGFINLRVVEYFEKL